MSQRVFYEAAINEPAHCDDRLSVGSTISWSSISINRPEEAAFTRRDSYPVIVSYGFIMDSSISLVSVF